MAFDCGGTLEGSKCSRRFHNNSFSKKVHNKRNCLLLFGQCALFTSKGLKCPWECENFKGAVLKLLHLYCPIKNLGSPRKVLLLAKGIQKLQ